MMANSVEGVDGVFAVVNGERVSEARDADGSV
jgi:hypothetical protein